MEDRKDPFEDIERRRVELESNVAKLRASLLHWQTWEIEYESLKEEILELGELPTPGEVETLANLEEAAVSKTQGSSLTRKERLEVLRNEKGVVRSRDEISNLLSRRIDYVQQNVKSAKSLLSVAEERLVATEVLKEAKAPNEEGLPLTEIYEELDEDGNVTASSTSISGQKAAQAVEAIEEAAKNRATEVGGKNRPAVSSSKEVLKATSEEEASKYSHKAPMPKVNIPTKRVSSVSDMESMADPAVASDHEASETSLPKALSDREIDEIERSAMAAAIIPEDESPEDAALRRQMIQYNMDEVGAVVAELDLEDDAKSLSEYDSEALLEDDEDEEVDDEDDEDDELEDEVGRTAKSKPLNEAFVERMQALSNKLKADAMINIGPQKPSETKTDSVRPREAANGASTKGTPNRQKGDKKKGVRFAEDLEIQEAPEVSVANLLAASSAMTGTPVLLPQDSKRAASAEVPIEEMSAGGKKMSKFKAARAQAATNSSIANTFNSTSKNPISPTTPPKLLADTLVERPFTSSTHAPLAPDEADELNPILLKNQISSEYHRLRARQIQREGGFVRDTDDQAEVQLTEEEGGPKRMSRFKAARLGLQ